MLAAHAAGLGTCWIGFAQGFLNTPGGKSELGLPIGCVPVAPIIVGHPKAAPRRQQCIGLADRASPRSATIRAIQVALGGPDAWSALTSRSLRKGHPPHSLGERDRTAASAGFSDLIQINASAPNQNHFTFKACIPIWCQRPWPPAGTSPSARIVRASDDNGPTISLHRAESSRRLGPSPPAERTEQRASSRLIISAQPLRRTRRAA